MIEKGYKPNSGLIAMMIESILSNHKDKEIYKKFFENTFTADNYLILAEGYLRDATEMGVSNIFKFGCDEDVAIFAVTQILRSINNNFRGYQDENK